MIMKKKNQQKVEKECQNKTQDWKQWVSTLAELSIETCQSIIKDTEKSESMLKKIEDIK